MNRFLTSTVCGVVCFAMTSAADAQIVRVGPFGGVSVRAPFVSVDAIPGGGARVRAPFTSVNTGVFSFGYGSIYRPYGYGYYRPYGFYNPVPVYPSYPVYPVPSYAAPVYPEANYPVTGSVYPRTGQYQSARPVTNGTIPERLRSSAQRLRQSLSTRRDDADVWIEYLGPDRIIETIDSAADPSALSDLLLNYEGVVGNATLGTIRRAGGFDETYRLLREFVATPASSAVPIEPPAKSEPPAKNADSILVPSSPVPQQPVPQQPVPEQPTPATPVKPADAGKEAEELPLPPQPSPL